MCYNLIVDYMIQSIFQHMYFSFNQVDFLQKAEAAASKRIDELEALEKELREQLEQRTDSKNCCQRELNKIQELKHQITFLETDNKALSARVAELEENEEILRENWRRVADEDFNRTQCLEEKVIVVFLFFLFCFQRALYGAE